MARKFLYLIVVVVVLIIVALAALRLWPERLAQLALVPSGEFKEQPALPPNIYRNPAMWFSRPEIPAARNPALWTPAGASPPTAGPAEQRVAVFFVHPTSYLQRAGWNAPLEDGESQLRARLFIRGQASLFNGVGEIWAPRYRQAAIGAFLTDQPAARRALDLAYHDVAQAFDAFIASLPPDRPIVLAGHSQGSLHLIRLLREKVAGTPLSRRVVAAYIVGWPISIAHDLPALGLPRCSAPDQAGCILSWQSFGPDGDPGLVEAAYRNSPGLDGQLRAGSPMLCTNPLTGGAAPAAPASANLGTLVPSADLSSGVLTPRAVGAACDAKGFLVLDRSIAMGPFVLPGQNYHIYDYPLFWANARADVARRVQAFRGSRAPRGR